MFKFNLKIILYVIGILLLFNGGLMLLSALTSLLMKDGVSFEIALSAFIVIAIGSLMMIIFRGHKPNIQKREGYLIVTMGWLLMAITGMIPFLVTGSISSVYDAFFETMSGYTATGSSILKDIESLPAGILFWRSMMH